MSAGVAGRAVLVTGPARGIGAEVARRLAARGARLALVGLEPERLEALARELGPPHVWFECDVTRQAALERAVEHTVAALGGIDVVIANAGVASNGTVAVTPVEALVRVLDVNLGGVVRTVSATLPHVTARRGYYLIVSSAAALAALPGMSTYAASKAGVEQFANVLRLEVAPAGVAVGTAYPSWIDTDLVRDMRHDLPTFEEALGQLPGPLGSVTTVDACAAALVRAVETRRRRVFVPRSLGPLLAARGLFSSAIVERVMAWRARTMVPRAEAEMRGLGRAFGEHSVGLAERPGDAPGP